MRVKEELGLLIARCHPGIGSRDSGAADLDRRASRPYSRWQWLQMPESAAKVTPVGKDDPPDLGEIIENAGFVRLYH